MPIRTLSRRHLLRGMLATGGAVAVPLPLLDIMVDRHGRALAQTAVTKPLRYVTWFFETVSCRPLGAGGDRQRQCLELESAADAARALQSHLTVVSGLDRKIPGLPHPGGSAAATTGGPSDIAAGGVLAPSIDQIAATALGAGSLLKSLEVGVTPATPNGPEPALHSVSHRGPNAILRPQFDPKAVFARLFAMTSSSGTSTAALQKMLAVKKSVLDAVLSDANELKARVGAADKMRLDEHMTGISALEKQLVVPPSSCAIPAAPALGPDAKSEAPANVNAVMADLTVLALSCGLTNAATFTFTLPAAHVYYRHLAANMNDDFHDNICHADAGDQSNQPRVHTGVLYAMTCFAEFLKKLQAASAGAGVTGTLLDNTLVYVTSCTAWGKTHTMTDWPVLLAGKAAGKLAGDRHVRFPGQNLSRVLLSIANMVGDPRTQLGVAEGLVSTPLPGLA